MKIRPKLTSTNSQFSATEWYPKNFDAFLEELDHIVSFGTQTNRLLLFRGHADYRWLLDSTIIRWIKKNVFGISELSKLKSPFQCSQYANLFLGSLLLFKFKVSTSPSKALLQLVENNPQIDPYFEWMKRIQQYPKEDLGAIEGSFLLDWTQNPNVALYFSNLRSDDKTAGAVFIADSTAMGSVLHRDKKLEEVLEQYAEKIFGNEAVGCPLLFSPRAQKHQKRATNQEAVYFAQMDLRLDLAEHWSLMMEKCQDGDLLFIKLILPPGSGEQCKKWLEEKGITKDFLFPDEKERRSDENTQI